MGGFPAKVVTRGYHLMALPSNRVRTARRLGDRSRAVTPDGAAGPGPRRRRAVGHRHRGGRGQADAAGETGQSSGRQVVGAAARGGIRRRTVSSRPEGTPPGTMLRIHDANGGEARQRARPVARRSSARSTEFVPRQISVGRRGARRRLAGLPVARVDRHGDAGRVPAHGDQPQRLVRSAVAGRQLGTPGQHVDLRGPQSLRALRSTPRGGADVGRHGRSSSLRLGRRLGLSNTVLIPLMFTGQQLFDRHAFLGLTEVPFMLGITLVSVLILENRRGAAALIAGCLPLIRSEGALLTVGLALLFLRRRQWRELGWSARPTCSTSRATGSSSAPARRPARPTQSPPRSTVMARWSTEIDHVTHGVGLVLLVLSAMFAARSAAATAGCLRRLRLPDQLSARARRHLALRPVRLRLATGLPAAADAGDRHRRRRRSRVVRTRAAAGAHAAASPSVPDRPQPADPRRPHRVVPVVCLAVAALVLTRGLATPPWVRDADAVPPRTIVHDRRARSDPRYVRSSRRTPTSSTTGARPAVDPGPRADPLGTIPKVSLDDVRAGRRLHLGRPLLTPGRSAHRGPRAESPLAGGRPLPRLHGRLPPDRLSRARGSRRLAVPRARPLIPGRWPPASRSFA